LTQRGIATQENKDEGLTAHHPVLPKGSKAKVTNLANGKEIEVTITERIAPSASRVIDLSPAAARALDIGFGGPVEINQILAVRVPSVSEPSPPPVPGRQLVQRGMATQEMTDIGLTAAHPSLPIDSKARITNVANGKEVEVTITKRINLSSTRIVDLSPATAMALDIGFGGPVIVAQIISPSPPPPPPLTQSGFPTQEIQRQPLIQIGMATQEMTDIGLTAAHPSLPIYSRAKVTNIATGKEIDVVITERIPPSTTRVIDLSPDAASALDIGKGGPVIIKEPPPQ
jgi:rare lipoprotein A (peptidoglycan hydrolase)